MISLTTEMSVVRPSHDGHFLCVFITAVGLSLDDLTSKRFALISVVVSCFDNEHVDKYVKDSFTIMDFTVSFDKRF
jgi:hypothetical protein